MVENQPKPFVPKREKTKQKLESTLFFLELFVILNRDESRVKKDFRPMLYNMSLLQANDMVKKSETFCYLSVW